MIMCNLRNSHNYLDFSGSLTLFALSSESNIQFLIELHVSVILLIKPVYWEIPTYPRSISLCIFLFLPTYLPAV